MRTLQCRFGKQDTIIGHYTHRVTEQMRETTDQGLTIKLFEFIEFAAVDQTRDDFADIVGLAQIIRHDAV